MKVNKFLMLGIAGLAFAACSNEEDFGTSDQVLEGYGAVSIRIAAPAVTKNVVDGATGSEVIVKPTGNVTIKLEATEGSNEINLTPAQWEKGQVVTFWNVMEPKKVTVTMNGGQNTYAEIVDEEGTTPAVAVEAAALQSAPESIPAYGETTDFTLTGETGSPTGGDHEVGAPAGNTVYQKYKATVTMKIPVARLEVSGIQHIFAEAGEEDNHVEEDCAYETLSIAGVYLDNVYANGTGVSYVEGTGFTCATGTPTNYKFGGTPDTGTGIDAVLKDAITENTNFLTADMMWPSNGQVYAYNFFGADGIDNLPKFKIYFNESVSKDEDHPLPAPRYAMVTKYTRQGADGPEDITKFEPGHIYRITGVKLLDENILGDEGGNTKYGVEVTVVEAKWTVETISADWAN